MSKARNVPWLMWGSETNVRIPALVAGGPVFNPQQLVALDYGRPDSWSFLFIGRVLQVQGANPVSVTMFFDVALGLGRATTTLAGRAFGFETYFFSLVAPGDTTRVKWSTSVLAPQTNDLDVNPPRAFIDVLPAQTLNIQCRVLATALVADTTVDVSMAAYVAPRTHVRPDWFGQMALGSGER